MDFIIGVVVFIIIAFVIGKILFSITTDAAAIAEGLGKKKKKEDIAKDIPNTNTEEFDVNKYEMLNSDSFEEFIDPFKNPFN